jgi:hypothetical protein
MRGFRQPLVRVRMHENPCIRRFAGRNGHVLVSETWTGLWRKAPSSNQALAEPTQPPGGFQAAGRYPSHAAAGRNHSQRFGQETRRDGHRGRRCGGKR